MITGIALLAGGVGLYALSGSALSGHIACHTRDELPTRVLKLLPLALGEVLAFAFLTGGIAAVYDELALRVFALPIWLLAMLPVAPAGLIAAGLLRSAFARPSEDGGFGPDDLGPPPDPDGPDGWAAFERQFRAYASARDTPRSPTALR